jgi:FtsP/CotA-like multicopper oxidase with cupredoxin domain
LARPDPAARFGLPRRNADRTVTIDLGGGGDDYVWNINGMTNPHAELAHVVSGERVEFEIRNHTNMAHPMHLHGHHFQIVAIGATRIDGAMRDTVLVPADGRVTIAFDADNPGLWAFHCHHLYHQNSGMMGAIAYEK